jgi:dTMP kinase|tara:strand:- start:9672 stop:10298 length:627 start_codon:yes stop_codon:yes gene_type:complete
MRKNKFFFIVFEGVEGTGKSYQIKKLYNNLKKLGYNLHKTREPGGSKTAEKIRNLIFSKTSSNFDKLTDYYLMNAARNEHIKKTLLVLKKNKKVVISDRFTDSTYAYQVMANKIDKNVNFMNQKYILKGLKPNLTIVLKSNFKSIYSRIKKRNKSNKFDKLKTSFYKQAQNAFLSLAKKNRNYLVFDSSKNTTDLEKIILSEVIKKIN